jgi:hypothetical protein
MASDQGHGRAADQQDRLVLMPSNRKAVASLLVTASFAVAGIALVAGGGSLVPLGWIFILMFVPLTGAGVLTWRALRSGKVFLELTRGGFAVHTVKETATCPWASVERFAAESVAIPVIGLASWQSRVYFDLLPGSPRLGRPWSVWAQASGHDGVLPDSYTMRPMALSALMNEWRLRATGGEH